MQIDRLFRLLYLLLEQERIPAEKLAKALEVSVRTVYRDVQTLCEAGIPLYAERGRNGGVSILPSFKLNRSVVSSAEKNDILSALQAMAVTGASNKATLHKLSAFFGGESMDWVRIDFSDWSGEHNEMIRMLKTAVINRHMLGFDYYNTSGICQPRRVCPIRLWFKNSAWYLLAYCTEKRDLRTFKLTRIKRLQILPDEFSNEALSCLNIEPKDILPDAQPLPFLLRIDDCMAFRVYDDFDETQISRTENGDFLVHAAFIPDDWLISFILSYREHIQVLEPASLRDAVQKTLEKISLRYQN